MPKFIPNFKILVILIMLIMPKASAAVVSGQIIEELITSKINETLDARGDYRRREVNFTRGVQDVTVPAGNIELTATLPGNINFSTGNFNRMTSVSVKFVVNGKSYHTMSFSVNVRVYDTVLIANRDLTFDKPVMETDFRVEEVAVDGRNEYVKDYEAIKGLVPSRFIQAGSPISLSYFQTAVVIQSNQTVRILIRQNGIVASATGVALNRGRVGQMIRVRNTSSGKIITGKVVDAQTVEVVY